MPPRAVRPRCGWALAPFRVHRERDRPRPSARPRAALRAFAAPCVLDGAEAAHEGLWCFDGFGFERVGGGGGATGGVPSSPGPGAAGGPPVARLIRQALTWEQRMLGQVAATHGPFAHAMVVTTAYAGAGQPGTALVAQLAFKSPPK